MAVKYATTNRELLKILKIDVRSVRVFGFSDTLFANTKDIFTQLGRIYYLCDDFERKFVSVSDHTRLEE